MINNLEQKINKKGDKIIEAIKTRIITKLKPYTNQIYTTAKILSPLGDAGIGILLYDGIQRDNHPEIFFGAFYFASRVIYEYYSK